MTLPAIPQPVPRAGERLPLNGERVPQTCRRLPQTGARLPPVGGRLPQASPPFPQPRPPLPLNREPFPQAGEGVPQSFYGSRNRFTSPATGLWLPQAGERVPQPFCESRWPFWAFFGLGSGSCRFFTTKQIVVVIPAPPPAPAGYLAKPAPLTVREQATTRHLGIGVFEVRTVYLLGGKSSGLTPGIISRQAPLIFANGKVVKRSVSGSFISLLPHNLKSMTP